MKPLPFLFLLTISHPPNQLNFNPHAQSLDAQNNSHKSQTKIRFNQHKRKKAQQNRPYRFHVNVNSNSSCIKNCQLLTNTKKECKLIMTTGYVTPSICDDGYRAYRRIIEDIVDECVCQRSGGLRIRFGIFMVWLLVF